MGKKKKDKHSYGEHRQEHGQPEGTHAEMRFQMPPQMAGLAAMMAKQAGSPAMQQMIAGALGAAADAMKSKAAARTARAETAAQPVPPRAPTPPVPPEPSIAPIAPEPSTPPIPPEPQAAYRPHFDTPPIQLSPEAVEAIERVAHQAAQAIEGAAASASKAIETAAQAFEQWVERKTTPRSPES